MANPIYDATNNKPQNYNIIQQYNSFRNDPFTFLLKTKGIDIPQQYRNDPQGAGPYFDNENSYDGGRYPNRGRYSMDSKDEMRKHLEMALSMAKTEPERQNIRNMLDNM